MPGSLSYRQGTGICSFVVVGRLGRLLKIVRSETFKAFMVGDSGGVDRAGIPEVLSCCK